LSQILLNILHRVSLYLTFLIITANHSFAQSGVVIKEYRSEYECRMCYGKLVVTNGHKTDTIFGGQWGNIPNYRIEKIKNNEVIVIEDNYGYPGGQIIKLFKILTLDDDHFLSEIFRKEITLYKEFHRNRNNNPVNFIYSDNPIIKLGEYLEIINQISLEYCPEKLGETCYCMAVRYKTECFDLDF